MITYEELKEKPKEFLSATGLEVKEFAHLLAVFATAYAAHYPADKTRAGKARQRKPGGGAKGRLAKVEDRLLFILMYQKTYPLQTIHGLLFDLSQAQTNEWIHRLLPVLQDALARLGLTPEREAAAVAKREELRELGADVLLDGTERRRQRPQDGVAQVAHYSGKKKAHTDKNWLLVHAETGQVLYLSPTAAGKVHDKKLADDEQITYPARATLAKDTGFQGYEPAGTLTYQPKKTQGT